jgi:hypothetical protein
MLMATPQAVSAPVFLTAEWLHLVLLNYTVPPSLLEPLVPKGTELHLLRGGRT